jgi:hypothetical protein
MKFRVLRDKTLLNLNAKHLEIPARHAASEFRMHVILTRLRVVLVFGQLQNWRFGLSLNPDCSRCVGVDMEKACFVGVLFQVCGFDSSSTA